MSPYYQFSNNTSSSNKILRNSSPIKMTHENLKNVHINSSVSLIGTNKTIRPITFKSPVKSTINLNSLNQQKNNPLFS